MGGRREGVTDSHFFGTFEGEQGDRPKGLQRPGIPGLAPTLQPFWPLRKAHEHQKAVFASTQAGFSDVLLKRTSGPTRGLPYD
jgi:hypothetical protein